MLALWLLSPSAAGTGGWALRAWRAYQQGDGKWSLELEDGAVWVQTESATLGRRPKDGSTVEIRKAAMGSYFINIDGQRAIRAKRVK